MQSVLQLGGVFHIECIGADGKTKWKDRAKNLVVNVGLNKILDVMFNADTQITTWYVGLIDDDGYGVGPQAGDTMASHAGWNESADYSESLRQEWTEGAASSQSITNAVSVDFSINATETMKGIFLVSDNTKSGSAGTLWAAALFSGGDQAVSNGDTLKVTYTINAADA